MVKNHLQQSHSCKYRLVSRLQLGPRPVSRYRLIPAALDNNPLHRRCDSACCVPTDRPRGVWEISALNEPAGLAPTPTADGRRRKVLDGAVFGRERGRHGNVRNTRQLEVDWNPGFKLQADPGGHFYFLFSVCRQHSLYYITLLSWAVPGYPHQPKHAQDCNVTSCLETIHTCLPVFVSLNTLEALIHFTRPLQLLSPFVFTHTFSLVSVT